MTKLEYLHCGNIQYVQSKYPVDELTSFYLAESITAIDMGWVDA